LQPQALIPLASEASESDGVLSEHVITRVEGLAPVGSLAQPHPLFSTPPQEDL